MTRTPPRRPTASPRRRRTASRPRRRTAAAHRRTGQHYGGRRQRTAAAGLHRRTARPADRRRARPGAAPRTGAPRGGRRRARLPRPADRHADQGQRVALGPAAGRGVAELPAVDPDLRVVSVVLVFVLIGFVLLPIVGLTWLVCTIIGSIRAGARRGLPLPGHDPDGPADASRQQVAHHGVGEQPALAGEHQPLVVLDAAARGRPGRAPRRARRASSTSSGRPSRSRSSSSTRSTRRVSASSTSRACAGLRPGGEPVGVRRRVLDVPPPHPADVGVRARADAPPVAAGPVERGCAGSGRRRRGPSWTPRTSRARPRSSRSSARTYLSARSSSSGIGSSPRRTRRASAVPSSTISEYAETWSGAQASAASSEASQSASDSPGVP